MNYVIPAAGMGTRMGARDNPMPKCLISIGAETLLERLIRQIRTCDTTAAIYIVAGFKKGAVAAHAPGCSIIVNPFFDITGINASLWFARACFDDAVTIIHGDIVFSDTLIRDMLACAHVSYMGYDSSILDPKELNVRVAEGRIERFGVKFSGFSGAYTGVLRFQREHARLFAGLLDTRMQRGFNEKRTYYFQFIRAMINEHGAEIGAFNFAGYDWAEIDYRRDLERARRLFGQQ
jgi:L-glutamine-phosphate cytidylyltransferase